jgi:hypothetical protein
VDVQQQEFEQALERKVQPLVDRLDLLERVEAERIERTEAAALATLSRQQAALAALIRRQAAKEFYTTAEAAAALGKAEFTVREWCRHGRVRADKKGSGRGKHQAWVISHDELRRYQREGLLPSRHD